jgi:hypothetical protein
MRQLNKQKLYLQIFQLRQSLPTSFEWRSSGEQTFKDNCLDLKQLFYWGPRSEFFKAKLAPMYKKYLCLQKLFCLGNIGISSIGGFVPRLFGENSEAVVLKKI